MSFVDTDVPLTWCLTRGLSSLQCSAGTFSCLQGAITTLSSGFHLILIVRRRAKKNKRWNWLRFFQKPSPGPTWPLEVLLSSAPTDIDHLSSLREKAHWIHASLPEDQSPSLLCPPALCGPLTLWRGSSLRTFFSSSLTYKNLTEDALFHTHIQFHQE